MTVSMNDDMRRQISRLPDTFFEKEASLLGLLGAATAFHVAPNLAMKVVKKTDAGHRALTNTFAAGVNHGRTAQKLHPNIESVATYGIGPESMVEYELGRKLGKKLYSYGDESADYYLNALRRNVRSKFRRASPEVQEQLMHTPVIGTVKRYFDGQGEGRINDFLTKRGVPFDAKPTIAQKATNVGLLGAAGAVDPHLLFQPAISYARKKTAESPIGKKLIQRNFENGKAGKEMSKGKRILTDMVVSPSVLDPYRIGKSYAATVPQETRNIIEPLAKDVLQNKKVNGVYMPSKDYLLNQAPNAIPMNAIRKKIHGE